MAGGYEGIVTPYNTEEFQNMVNDVRAHLNADGAALQDVGVDLRRLLPHARTAAGRDPFGIDLKIAAWRVARYFAQADASLRGASASLGKAYEVYYGTFHNPRARSTHGRQFDAS